MEEVEKAGRQVRTLRVFHADDMERVIPFAGYYTAIWIITHKGFPKEILASMPKDVKSLLIQGTETIDFSFIELFTELENLGIETKSATQVDVTHLGRLTSLNVDHTKSASRFGNLKIAHLGIGLRYSQHAFDISSNINLKELRLYRTSESEIRLVKNSSVSTLITLDHKGLLSCGALEGMPNLRNLTIEGRSEIDDVSALRDFSRLETLTINIKGAVRGLGSLAGSSLQRIYLKKTSVEDDELRLLKEAGVEIFFE